MSVALRKIEGVDTVTVSLNDGVADIRLKPGNTVDPEAVRKTVRDNGFTPKAADVRVRGNVGERDGQLMLFVTGSELLYALVEHPNAKSGLHEVKSLAASAEVSVTGRLPERLPDAPRTLELYDFHPLGK